MSMDKLAETLLGAMQDQANRAVPTTLVVASVVSAPPNLTIKFGENIIPSDQIYCSNYLLPHYHRDYTIKGTVDMYDFENTTSDVCATDGADAIPKLQGTGKYETHGDLWDEDTLKAGDEVLCGLVGVNWVVITKITKMPSKAIDGV